MSLIQKLVYFVLSLLLTNAGLAVAQKPSIDFAHYWISPGEKASLKVFEDAFRARGGDWQESRAPDYELMKRDLVRRLAAGYAPSATWIGAEGLDSAKNFKWSMRLDEPTSTELNAATLHDVVTDTISINGQILALPVAIHNEYWAWYNAEVYRSLRIPLPNSWDDVLKSAPRFLKNGIAPIAVSDQGWTARILFTNMVASVAGRDIYTRMYVTGDASVLDEPLMRKAIDTFIQLRAFRLKPGLAKTWDDATRLVVQGGAAMQVMGDWAKVEFPSIGTDKTGKFVCAPVPGKTKLFIAAVDMLAFPQVQAPEVQAGQRLFTKVVLDKQLQVEFARKKGALPVRRDVDLRTLDSCARVSAELLTNPFTQVKSARSTSPEVVRTNIQHAVAGAWKDDSVSAQQLGEQIRRVLKKGG